MLTLGVNVVTMGNHTWGKKEIFNFIEDERIVRPANYPEGVPGVGYRILNCNGKNIAVINLIGRVTMGVLSENPFVIAKDIVDEIVIVDTGSTDDTKDIARVLAPYTHNQRTFLIHFIKINIIIIFYFRF